jgi:hypothetical protein
MRRKVAARALFSALRPQGVLVPHGDAGLLDASAQTFSLPNGSGITVLHLCLNPSFSAGCQRTTGARSMCSRGDEKDGVFVSDHFELRPGTVESLLERVGEEHRRGSGGWLQLRTCPDSVCKGSPRQRQSKHDQGNQYTFGVNASKGAYHCFRCEAKGNWFQLKAQIDGKSLPIYGADQLGGSGANRSGYGQSQRFGGGAAQEDAADPEERFQAFLQYSEVRPPHLAPCIATWGLTRRGRAQVLERCLPAMDWFTKTRCIRPETLRAYKVGVAQYRFRGLDLLSVTFPWFNDSEELPVRVKARALEDKKFMRLDPQGGGWGFFGWNLIVQAEAAFAAEAASAAEALSAEEQGSDWAKAPDAGSEQVPDTVFEGSRNIENSADEAGEAGHEASTDGGAGKSAAGPANPGGTGARGRGGFEEIVLTEGELDALTVYQETRPFRIGWALVLPADLTRRRCPWLAWACRLNK